MREIKIKFWDSLMNAWATDWLAINDGRIVADNEGKEFVDVPDVDRFIPYQYTGLKDKNGKEICEGDIVQHSFGIGVIEFRVAAFVFIMKDRDIPYQLNAGVNTEIIGNIYENPEPTQ